MTMAEEKGAPNSLNTLLFPMSLGKLLFPDVAVAEIVDYQKPRSVETDVDWLLGDIQWRGIQLPVISFDKLNEQKPLEMTRSSKIVVMHSLDQRQSCNFWAFVVHDAPTMQTVNTESLVQNEKKPVTEAVVMQAELMGLNVLLPNMAFIEKRIQETYFD